MKRSRKFTTALFPLALLLAGCSQTTIELANTKGEQVVELGSKNEVDMTEFLDREKMSVKDIQNSKFDIELPDKFDKLETYNGTVSLEGMFGKSVEKEISVKVTDTTAPKFSKDMPKEIRVEQNAKCVQWFKLFKFCVGKSPYVTDLQDYEIEISGTEKVDLSKAGLYEITVEATDKSKNTADTKVKVNVVASKVVQAGDIPTSYLRQSKDEEERNEVPISEATETKVVTGKLKVPEEIKTTVEGQEVSKGKYSTTEKQQAYQKKLAEEKKKKEEAEKKRKAEEAKKKAEAEAERKRQAELAKQQQSSSNYEGYYTPVQPSRGGTPNVAPYTPKPSGSSVGSSTATTKTPTQSTPNACDNSKPATYKGHPTFWSDSEAVVYADSQTANWDNNITRWATYPRFTACGKEYVVLKFWYAN